MKKLILAVTAVLLLAPLVLAAGNAEKLETLEGEVVLTTNAAGLPALMLRMADGELLEVGIGEAELEKLQLQVGQRIQVQGVFIGATSENQIQEKVLARTMVVNGKKEAIAEPVQLTEREKLQVREYEAEQAALRTKEQERVGGGGESAGSGLGESQSGSGSTDPASGSGQDERGNN